MNTVNDECAPHGIPRPERRGFERLRAVVLQIPDAPATRTRFYFLNPATDLQVLVNAWPDGSLDTAFETAPGVFGAPVTARRTESEIVT